MEYNEEDDCKKSVTPLEYLADVIAALHEGNFFEEHRIIEDEVRKHFMAKMKWKAEVNEGYFALDAEEIEEVLCQCIDIAVDNTFSFLVEKGLADMHVMESGEFGYTATEKAKGIVDKDRVVGILQGKIK